MPWTPGTATGLGPFPGVDPLEAARIVFSELPDLPFLPELPARGVGVRPGGADGRAPGRPPRRGRDRRVAVRAPGREGRAAGPRRPDHRPRRPRGGGRALRGIAQDPDRRAVVPGGQRRAPEGEKALADPGAVRDIAGALAEGLTRHMADIRRRLPASRSSWSRWTSRSCRRCWPGSWPQPAAGVGFGATSGRGGGRAAPGAGRCRREDLPGVWLGDAGARSGLCRKPGARFLGIDGAVLDSVDEDEVGEAIDAGLGLLVACVPLDTRPLRDPRPVTAAVRRPLETPQLPDRAAPRNGGAHPVRVRAARSERRPRRPQTDGRGGSLPR